MAMYQGNVAFLNERKWNNKTLYSLKLRDDDTLYLCGERRPNARQGDYVTFEAEENAKGQFVVDVKTVKAKAAEVVMAKSSGLGKFQANSYDKRQETIEYQAARNSAIAAVGVILEAGAFKLPAKEADKYGIVLGLISELTDKFFKETKTLGAKPSLPEAEEPEQDETDGDEDSMNGDWD